MDNSVLEYFVNVYIPDDVKIALSTHGFGKVWSIVRTGQRCNQSSSNIHNGTFDKKANLKTLTILAKGLILDALLGPGRVSVIWYFTVLKKQTKKYIDRRSLKMESI